LNKANEYAIDLNFMYLTTVDRMGLVSRSSETNVETYDVILNQSPEYPRQSGRIRELVLSSASNTGSSSGVTFIITKTTDGQPPRNVIPYIEGCNQQFPKTKAQVEETGTTTSSGLCMIKIFSVTVTKFFF
jgi:hypothetical protein